MSGEYCSSKYVFGLHGVHEAASTCGADTLAPVVPSGQRVHAWFPGVALNMPLAHGRQGRPASIASACSMVGPASQDSPARK